MVRNSAQPFVFFLFCFFCYKWSIIVLQWAPSVWPLAPNRRFISGHSVLDLRLYFIWMYRALFYLFIFLTVATNCRIWSEGWPLCWLCSRPPQLIKRNINKTDDLPSYITILWVPPAFLSGKIRKEMAVWTRVVFSCIFFSWIVEYLFLPPCFLYYTRLLKITQSIYGKTALKTDTHLVGNTKKAEMFCCQLTWYIHL